MTVPAGLLLTPGSGGDRTHQTLEALEQGLSLPVRRVDFPYRKQGRRAPDRAPKLVAAVREEAASFAADLGVSPAQLLLGGRSMGGRMCSLAAGEGLACAGLVLLSYPLHPPGKPDRLRVDHFPQLAMPCLFVSGARDPFGKPDEFARHLPDIAGPVTSHWLEGVGVAHDPKRHDEEIVSVVSQWIAGLGDC